ncbi:hypothetical protein AV926_14980 [Myroides marinus]|uniref:CMP/dCMP-type deaminase domain-containing protein n=1 Tax=Myroides marinus TaxID=703342 RepID=A0A163WR40_9FLAO|nr:hypothetical protein [Myroides marinus]KZE76711.1 hypothetical protein AV926_14980 [Myroides marinus]
MSLNEFYKLREDFIILGLTGKMQAGADKVVEILKSENLSENNKTFLDKFPDKYKVISQSESIKYRRINDFYNYEKNWKKFDIIEYKDVVLLFILKKCYKDNNNDFADAITNWINDLGTYKTFESPRFCSEKGIAKGSKEFIESSFNSFLKDELGKLKQDQKLTFNNDDFILSVKDNSIFFSTEYQEFAKSFFSKLDGFSIYLRHKLIHITSYCLRRFGSLEISRISKDARAPEKLKDIYKIAEVINAIIKHRRKETGGKAHIIIDRLKNSYEMNFFREKYSGYYTIAINRDEKSRKESIRSKINVEYTGDTEKIKQNFTLIEDLDKTEYLVSEFKEGKFEGFDIENCVQKADYHIWYDNELSSTDFYDRFKIDGKGNLLDNHQSENPKILERTNYYYVYQPLLIQVLKLTALIKQPALITPSYTERIMQIAFNAKLNSGCISRQVGAVVTSKNFSVKGIGWNEVANGQLPCSSRDIRDFESANKEDNHGFTLLELGESDYKYKDNKTFREKVLEDIKKIEPLDDNLQGRPCSFCFKSHHNAYEAKENQVHTRSLHAEENAMLQISKDGGQPLAGGNLFTTASTCELCAKKAYQLGIKNIFYIDVYPGISNDQILNNGYNIPNKFAYQGAIGRGFNKLYEPFMSQKDELYIRTKFKPTVSQKEQALQLQKIIGSKISERTAELKEFLNSIKEDSNIVDKIVDLMEKGLLNDSDS